MLILVSDCIMSNKLAQSSSDANVNDCRPSPENRAGVLDLRL